MPETTFAAILFCFLSGLAFSGAALRVLGRKAKVRHRGKASFPDAFLAGSVTFTLVYILNRLAFPARPKATAAANLLLLAGILLFPLVRKKLRRLKPRLVKKHPLQDEAAALERMFERDPLNAFCLEKLSELYEKMGEHDKALEAARRAAGLDPTVKNKWRAEDLEKEAGERKLRKDRRPWLGGGR